MSTTIKLSGGSFGNEQMLVRCDLSQASAPILVNYCTDRDSEFQSTQFQCADARHTNDGLIEIGKKLAATAIEVPANEFECESEEVFPKISITVDGNWAGDGIIRNGTIEDCAAILGGSQDEADRLYAEIEEAIESGDESLIDGDSTYAWTIE